MFGCNNRSIQIIESQAYYVFLSYAIG